MKEGQLLAGKRLEVAGAAAEDPGPPKAAATAEPTAEPAEAGPPKTDAGAAVGTGGAPSPAAASAAAALSLLANALFELNAENESAAPGFSANGFDAPSPSGLGGAPAFPAAAAAATSNIWKDCFK